MPGWAWMLFGLGIGLSVALVVYLRSPWVPAGTNQPAAQTAPLAEATSAAEPATQPAARASDSPATAGGESQQIDEPAYSFFADLSKSEVIVDTNEFDFGPGNGPPRVVLIQAGAFRDIDDADARQARLALLGYESHIDTGIVADELWFRVLIGPLTERGDVNEAARRLRSAGIETVLRTVAN